MLCWWSHDNSCLTCNCHATWWHYHALLIPLGLLGNRHMHHLPTSDITWPSQDQIKLGINNTVVIIKWPQGAWSLPTALAQHQKYPTTRYPRYHRDPYGDHNQLISLFLLLLTHGVPDFRPGPLSVGAAIDRFNIHSAEVSTLYPARLDCLRWFLALHGVWETDDRDTVFQKH